MARTETGAGRNVNRIDIYLLGEVGAPAGRDGDPDMPPGRAPAPVVACGALYGSKFCACVS